MKYKFLNVNPLDAREGDCVTRAIKLASGLSYEEVQQKLHLVATLFDCEFLCVCCYKFLLDYVLGYKRVEEFQGYTVEEFIDYNPNGVYLIRCDGHLTCSVNGTLMDTWDCRGMLVDLIWEVDT